MRKYFLKSWFGTQDTRSTGSVVSGLLVRGHWPTGEGQVLFSQEEGNPVLSACAETNRVLEWSSRHFLSVRLKPASTPLWSCCLFHGVDLYFKIDEAEKICTVQILLSLICISSLTRQLTGHLLVCVGFFFAPATCIWKWHIFCSFPFSSRMLPKILQVVDLTSIVELMSKIDLWGHCYSGPFLLKGHLKDHFRKLFLKPQCNPLIIG